MQVQFAITFSLHNMLYSLMFFNCSVLFALFNYLFKKYCFPYVLFLYIFIPLPFFKLNESLLFHVCFYFGLNIVLFVETT